MNGPRAPRTPPKLPRPAPAPVTVSPSLAALMAESAGLDRAAARSRVEQFWRAHEGESWPLLEEPGPAVAGGGLIVTFLWRDPEAAEVLLFVNRITDERDLAASLMRRVADSDLWHLSYLMGADWRASYSFLPRYPGQDWPWGEGDQPSIRAALDRGRADPRNPGTNRNRQGVVQSVVESPEAPAQPWLRPRSLRARGRVTAEWGPGRRRVWVYQPPGQADRLSLADRLGLVGDSVDQAERLGPVGDPADQTERLAAVGRPDGAAGRLPVVVLLDGEVWNSSQDATCTLDNLLADGLIRPALVLMPDSGGRERRWAEMDGSGGTADWVVRQLLPWARQRYLASADPADVIVAGQSLGGLTALRAALEHPTAVGGALAQSASLWQSDLGPALAGRDLSRLRAYIEVGAQEWVLRGPNQRLAQLMGAAGADVRFVEYNGGHDYACWRGGLADGLRHLLPADT
ncbi:MAG: DUF3327 domain-containing protein [Propionibacteriaceae bacterium]|nr:DUF3327 domain-containing protein [Propionibacteriaceae bacterium]